MRAASVPTLWRNHRGLRWIIPDDTFTVLQIIYVHNDNSTAISRMAGKLPLHMGQVDAETAKTYAI